MSTAAAEIFAEGYLKGFFDMVTTMMSEEATFNVAGVQLAEGDDITAAAGEFGAALIAPVKDGGGIVLLLPGRDAYAISATFMGEDLPTKDTVDPADAMGLQEIFDPCMGAGVSVFKERYGVVIGLDPVRVVSGKEAGPDIRQFAAAKGIYNAAFSYALPSDIEGQGLLLFSDTLADTIPPEAIPTEKTTGSSQVEQNASDEAPFAANSSGTSIPPNLDMVLDIRLVVKARLGRVEMPINEILGLGPGSIVEVGHLVDEPIELLVNDKLIARGDVVVVDEKFGLRITEIVSPKERIESLR